MSTDMSADAVAKSVIAVPPLARNADFSLNKAENRKIVAHMRAGSVSSFLYGGNANLYNIGLYEYAEMLDLLQEIAEPGDMMIPSAGPEYGRLIDQSIILRARKFPMVMVLPASAVMTQDGTMSALRIFAERLGRPIVLYLKTENYLSPENAAKIVGDGFVSWIKYAIVRESPAEDAYLQKLVGMVDANIVVSGIGELPAVAHMQNFSLQGFTSGSVCIAPRESTKLLQLLRAGNWPAAQTQRDKFIKFEGLRNSINPITVLHEGVRLAGIAESGPLLPLMSNVSDQHWASIRDAANELLQREAQAA